MVSINGVAHSASPVVVNKELLLKNIVEVRADFIEDFNNEKDH